MNPDAIVVGAGPAGLACAATMRGGRLQFPDGILLREWSETVSCKPAACHSKTC